MTLKSVKNILKDLSLPAVRFLLNLDLAEN
jgi:hypothetical protein